LTFRNLGQKPNDDALVNTLLIQGYLAVWNGNRSKSVHFHSWNPEITDSNLEDLEQIRNDVKNNQDMVLILVKIH
jgi:hypothetical protein